MVFGAKIKAIRIFSVFSGSIIKDSPRPRPSARRWRPKIRQEEGLQKP